MKTIKDFGKYFYVENPETHVKEKKDSVEQNKPIMTLELRNRLDEDVAIDLQFKIGKIAYDNLFQRELRFTTMKEVNIMMDIVRKMRDYEQAEPEVNYAVFMALNNYLLIKTATEESMFALKHKKFADYVADIVVWMHDQEKYVAPATAV